MASLSFDSFQNYLSRSTRAYTQDIGSGHIEKVLEIVGAIDLKDNYYYN